MAFTKKTVPLHLKVTEKANVKFTLEQAINAPRGSRVIR
jgi:hypothetical protein